MKINWENAIDDEFLFFATIQKHVLKLRGLLFFFSFVKQCQQIAFKIMRNCMEFDMETNKLIEIKRIGMKSNEEGMVKLLNHHFVRIEYILHWRQFICLILSKGWHKNIFHVYIHRTYKIAHFNLPLNLMYFKQTS